MASPSSFLRLATPPRHDPVEPCRVRETPTASRGCSHTPTVADVTALLRACRRRESFEGLRNAAVVILALDTGARANELRTLRTGDINVAERVARLIGKARPGQPPAFRFASLSPGTLKKVRTYLAARRDVPGDVLFCDRYGLMLSRRGFSEVMERLRARAGIAATWHGLQSVSYRVPQGRVPGGGAATVAGHRDTPDVAPVRGAAHRRSRAVSRPQFAHAVPHRLGGAAEVLNPSSLPLRSGRPCRLMNIGRVLMVESLGRLAISSPGPVAGLLRGRGTRAGADRLGAGVRLLVLGLLLVRLRSPCPAANEQCLAPGCNEPNPVEFARNRK